MEVYAEALHALEHSALGHYARHSSWFFTVANLFHVLGAALVVGAIAVFDVKLIASRGAGAAEVGRTAIPLAAAGLALQVPTGLVLLAVEATKLGVNPAFYAKLAFIAIGLANLALFHLRHHWALAEDTLPASVVPYGVISLGAWVLALLAGRMIAYL